MFKATAGVTVKIVRPLHQILCPNHAATENSSVRELENVVRQACGRDLTSVVQDRGTFAALQSKIVDSSELVRAYGIILTESERPSAISATWMRAAWRLISTCRVRFSKDDRWHPDSKSEISDPLSGSIRVK